MAKVSQQAHGNVATAAKAKPEGDYELYCVEVKPAEAGGYVAEHRYRFKPKKGKGSGQYDCYPCGSESETYALADKAALLAHIGKNL